MSLVDSALLQDCFQDLGYDLEMNNAGLNSLTKWCKESHKNELSSVINGKPYLTSGDRTSKIDFFGESVLVKWVDSNTDTLAGQAQIMDAFREVPTIKLPCENSQKQLHPERIESFRQLIKTKLNELSILEAFAANVSVLTVQGTEALIWLDYCRKTLTVRRLSEHIKSGNRIFMLRLDTVSYSLKNFIPALAASVQFDEGITFMIFVDDDSCAPLLLPLFYLIDLLNQSGILKKPNNILFMNSSCNEVLAVNSLAKVRKEIKITEGVVAIGYAEFPHLSYRHALVDLSLKNGRSVNFVVTDSADVSSAISGVSRNMWKGGRTDLRHCRSLAFVHQSHCTTFLKDLKSCVEKWMIGSASEVMMSFDYIARRNPPNNELLNCITTLGAKTIETCKGFDGPLVVYDIGTSSELVAIKKPGLGHVLVVIPYRSVSELHSLANNFVHTHKIVVYSTDISTTRQIVKNLEAQEVVINDTQVEASTFMCKTARIDVSSAVFTLTKDSPIEFGDMEERVFKIGPNKIWPGLSVSEKAQRIGEFLDVGVGPKGNIMCSLLYSFFALRGESRIRLERGINGIVFLGLSGMVSEMFYAVSTFCVKGATTVIGFLNTEIPDSLNEKIKSCLPQGLCNIVKMMSVNELKFLGRDWETIWIIHASDGIISSSILPNSEINKTLRIDHVENLSEEMKEGAWFQSWLSV